MQMQRKDVSLRKSATSGILRVLNMAYDTITCFVNFVHCPELYILENTTFRKLDLFPIPTSGEGRETPFLLGPLETS
jgi:hypothetical protein